MIRNFKILRSGSAALALTICLVGSLAACSGSSDEDGDAGQKQRGGTLKVLGAGQIDHLDPATSSFVPNMALMRAITRQLVSYKTTADEDERIIPQPDLAVAVPEPTDGGTTYEFTLRDDIFWQSEEGGDPQPIVAADFQRGFKRLCNPSLPSPMVGYFVSLIEGMRSFCDGFADVEPQAGPIREYIESTEISGLTAPSDNRLVFKLTEPASDFMYMLTLTVTAPAHEDVLAYLPDSPEYRDNYISSGPYTVAEYVPDKSLTLERNDAWSPDSDPLREANVDGVEMTFGLTNDSIMQQIRAGSADMFYDITPSPAVVQQLRAAQDDKLMTLPRGDVNPNLWINIHSPNNNGALANLKVRQALQYAVDKAAVVQTLGGESLSAVQNGIFGQGVLGHHDYQPYPSEGSKGDPEKAAELLAEAGYPDGITLKMPYRNFDVEPQIAQTLQASLERAGITVELEPVNSTDFYAEYMVNRDATKRGVWDIAPTGWTPDWQGGAARSVFQPQYTSDGVQNTYNYIDYNNDEANDLAAQALAAASAEEAAALWEKVDETVMADAVVIPVASRQAVLYHSDRVQDFLPFTLSLQGDWTTLWLEG